MRNFQTRNLCIHENRVSCLWFSQCKVDSFWNECEWYVLVAFVMQTANYQRLTLNITVKLPHLIRMVWHYTVAAFVRNDENWENWASNLESEMTRFGLAWFGLVSFAFLSFLSLFFAFLCFPLLSFAFLCITLDLCQTKIRIWINCSKIIFHQNAVWLALKLSLPKTNSIRSDLNHIVDCHCVQMKTFAFYLRLALPFQIHGIYHFITFASLATFFHCTKCERCVGCIRNKAVSMFQLNVAWMYTNTWAAKIIISYYRDILWLFVFTPVCIYIS